MEKNYRSELTCLFGDPVEENLTGVMMEAGYRAQGLNYRYLTLQVKKGELQKAMEAVRFFGIKGVNLTVPHKVDVIPFLDELSLSAEIIGAVNSVCNRDGVLVGENTDGKGFVTSLMEAGVSLSGKVLTILGAGGAARAVAVECAVSGAGKIYIINRNAERGRELAELIRNRTDAEAEYISWEGQAKIPEDTEVLVNATSIGMAENRGLSGASDDLAPDIHYEEIRKEMVVCDIVFNPPETEFLKRAKARGAKTVNGLGMLVNQAVLNYSLWTEHIAPAKVLYDALRREILTEESQTGGKAQNLGEAGAKAVCDTDADAADRNLIEHMVAYYAGDPKRIQHFLKVYEFARCIGEAEKIPEEELFILRTAAIVHDIGIKVSEEKYGNSSGKYQEKEGPAVAEPMLQSLGYEEDIIDRVLFLIANHHTYDKIEGADYQILVEADFLVNLYEDGCSRKTAENVKKNIFRTKTGLWYLEQLYLRQ